MRDTFNFKLFTSHRFVFYLKQTIHILFLSLFLSKKINHEKTRYIYTSFLFPNIIDVQQPEENVITHRKFLSLQFCLEVKNEQCQNTCVFHCNNFSIERKKYLLNALNQIKIAVLLALHWICNKKKWAMHV